MLWIAVLHAVLKCRGTLEPKTRYFLMHFIANMIIVANTYDDVWGNIMDPITFHKAHPLPAIYTVIFHLYHITCYDHIHCDEYIHHILNVFITTPLLLFNYNTMCNTAMFFM